MQVVLPEQALPAKLILNPELRMNDDGYYEFCMANAECAIRANRARGDHHRATGGRRVRFSKRGSNRAVKGLGKTRRSGQSLWYERGVHPSHQASVSSGRSLGVECAPGTVDQATKAQVPPPVSGVCGGSDVAERSSEDRAGENARLDGQRRSTGLVDRWRHQTVYIYRAGQGDPETRTGVPKLSGEGPVAGFELDLADIWAGL